MKRVAIIGGGIAGLSAAYYMEKARRDGAPLEWTLYEKSDRLGGVIRTEYRDGYVLEAGPDSFLTAKPEAAALARELGLADQLIQSNDRLRKTYILVKKRLLPIPDGLQFMVPTRVWPMATTPLFSLGTKVRMARELLLSPRYGTEDESVADFVRRHFGQEMVDRIAEPLLAGVYGGNAEHLSLRAVLPTFAVMEREHGSLARAALKARKKAAGAKPQPLFTSLKNGMQQLLDALKPVLPETALRLRQPVNTLRRVNNRWQVESAGMSEEFDAVLLAIPATATAALLASVDTGIASRMERIQYTSSAAVALAYDQASLPAGFGFLVPGTEGRKMMACTFVHNKFSFRAPEGSALLRCFFSSSRVPDLLTYSDEALEKAALQELREILGLEVAPRWVRAFRWNQALPQYETGHLERVGEIQARLEALPGLGIIGNSFYGVGIPDCIKSGRQAVERIVAG
ncbi:MAG TPA: protoporphyrinogen oxidase [Candidatus Saccharimonadales bacterium]|jgi:oxygen-dependent protoporphyrinogen oxidase|nr:protoporphyrinogen oxidase [Candidatus Saccharimonadales bacterium]